LDTATAPCISWLLCCCASGISIRYVRQMSPCVHVVGVLLLPLWVGMGNAATASCDANTGCGEETSLLQIGVGAEQKKLGQLSDGAGMGSQEGRSTMLQYGDDMLRLMTKKYGNASSEIGDDDEKLLRDIIVIIRDTIYTALNDSHNADVEEVEVAHQVVVDCNAALITKVNGPISTQRDATLGARNNHSNCRESARGNCENSTASLAALEQLIANIPAPPSVPAFPAAGDRTLAKVTAFFAEDNLYVIWYLEYNGTFSAANQKYESESSQCESSTVVCDTKQSSFEAAYDEFRLLYNITCDTFGTEFQDSSDAYAAVETRLEGPIADRKASLVAGETIAYKIGCLLGEHACVVPLINTDAYNLTFPALPASEVCDASEVQYHHCSQQFRDAEYVNTGITLAAPGLGCP